MWLKFKAFVYTLVAVSSPFMLGAYTSGYVISDVETSFGQYLFTTLVGIYFTISSFKCWVKIIYGHED